MTFLGRLFRSGRTAPVPEAPSPPEAGLASATVAMVAPPAPMPPVATLPVVPQTAPDWLTDERLLRDEGVIFGLSEARPEEKTAVIRTFFAHQTAGLERQIEQYNEKIGELNLFIGQRENSLAELEQQYTTLRNLPPAEHQLPRTVVGLLLACAMCVGNYFLIETALQTAYPTRTTFIAGGVFLAGMFGLFSRTSLFHDPAGQLSVRRVLEEIALPVVSAGFVWMMALQSQSAPMASALGLFVLGLFLFGGKLLLGLLTVLRDDLRAYSANRQLLRDQRAFTIRYETETKFLRQEMDQFRAQKWQILPDLTRAEAERDRLNARRDMLVRLFESEFNLARSVKDRLSDAQRRAILGES